MNESDVRRIVREMIEWTKWQVVDDDSLRGFHVRLVPPPEPTDCPDPGPAKDAASPANPGARIPAPQRETATGALSAELEEAAKDIARWAYIRAANGRDGETVDAILALVKREREAYAKEMASFCDENGWSRTVRKLYLDAGFKGDPVRCMSKQEGSR